MQGTHKIVRQIMIARKRYRVKRARTYNPPLKLGKKKGRDSGRIPYRCGLRQDYTPVGAAYQRDASPKA